MDKRLFILPVALSLAIVLADGYSLMHYDSQAQQANLFAMAPTDPEDGSEDPGTGDDPGVTESPAPGDDDPGSGGTEPVVTDVQPRTVDPGDQVTVTGSGFDADSIVRFNNAPMVTEFVSATTLRFTVPMDSVQGMYNVEVANGEQFSNEIPIDVNPLPTATPIATLTPTPQAIAITDVDPPSAGEGATVTLTGSGFTDNDWVEINSNIYPTTFLSETSLQFTVPGDVPVGPYQIKVGNDTAESNTVDFTVVLANDPGRVDCHRILAPADFPATTDYAPPYDVANGTNRLFITGTCGTDDTATATIGSADPTEVVYDTGYVYRNNNWSPVPLSRQDPNSPIAAEDWFSGVATATFNVTPGEIMNENFFVAFVCQWVDDTWKCGCNDAACAQNLWNVQVFRR